MSRLRVYRTEGVVIRQMPLGEADRILTLCSPDMGKVRAVAKGVRRTRSRLGGHLELLNRASVSVAIGRNLDTISEASAISTFSGIRTDLRRISRAMYVAELVDCFSMEGNGNQAIYHLAAQYAALAGARCQSRSADALVRDAAAGVLRVHARTCQLR